MYAVVRLRGRIGTREEILDTLEMLNLNKKFSCWLVPENESYEGMLQKVRNFVTWGEIQEEVLEEMLRKRAKSVGEDFDPSQTAKDLIADKSMKDLNLNFSIVLSPPSRGFKGSIKKIYPEGEAGYRGELINQLLEKMI